MPINQFQAPRSPIDAIAGALNVAGSVYKMKHASAAADLLNQQASQQELENKRKNEAFDDQNDPNSDASKAAQLSLSSAIDYSKQKGVINDENASQLKDLVLPKSSEINSETGEVISPEKPGLSALQISRETEVNPLFKFVSGQQAADAAIAKAATFAGPRIASYNSSMADKVHLDKIVLNSQDRINQANVDLNTLRNSPVITTQMLTELGSGLGRLVGGGKGGLTQTEEQTYKSGQGWLAKHAQEITGKQYNALPDDLRAGLDETYARLGEGWERVGAKRAESLYRKQPYADAEANMLQAIRTYSPNFQPGQTKEQGTKIIQVPKAASPAVSAHPQDNEAVIWAKANPNDPRAIKILQVNGVQ